jgi:hypothetical protein
MARSYAFIGVIVSISSLALGPFFQQSVVFYSSLVLDESAVSWASRAVDYNASVGFVSSFRGDECKLSISSKFLCGPTYMIEKLLEHPSI